MILPSPNDSSLREGNGKADNSLRFGQDSNSTDVSDHVRCEFSTEKGKRSIGRKSSYYKAASGFNRIKFTLWNPFGKKKKCAAHTLKRHIGGGSKADIDAVFFELKTAAGHKEAPGPGERLLEVKQPEIPRAVKVASSTQLASLVRFVQPMASKLHKVPRVELEREKEWVVEFYKDHKATLEIEGATITQNCQVRECDGATIQVKDKVNNVIIESCKRTNVILAGIISSVELIHCEKVKLQVLGSCPSVNLDNCSGFTMYVGKDGLDVLITTSKSCDMNIQFPSDDSDEYIETPIPQQFAHTINHSTKKLNSRVSDLYR